LVPLESQIGPWLAAVFVLYIAFAVLAMMNVVTGNLVLSDTSGCFWMFLDVSGCFWMFLDVSGCFWMFLLYFLFLVLFDVWFSKRDSLATVALLAALLNIFGALPMVFA
jgi:hypothetical protein